ncbi:hypothetical protein [Desulfoplanes formicivorans]|uniref:Uncharacterized protein n=1 Tax=Desulfoplanes formicivorans TaxID=1592317 RepID=A0A194AJM1_9BACT|nr:hypothetical protein [Desulfoplanes formicivorans]GAU09518.1 hypothetical protein DPF_2245 [Desulfoplanes formicivorans]
MTRWFNVQLLLLPLLLATFVFGFSTNSHADSGDKLIVVVGDTQKEALKGWINFLKESEFPVKEITTAEFDAYKKSPYIVLNGVPGDAQNNGPVLKKILTDQELKKVSESGNREYFIKDDVFTKGQTIVVFAGTPYSSAEGIRKNTQSDWLIMMSGWFDIELSPQAMYGY